MATGSYPASRLELIYTLTMVSGGGAGTTAGATSPESVDFSMYDDLTFIGTVIGDAGGANTVYIQDSMDRATFYDFGSFPLVATGVTTRFRVSPAVTATVTPVGTATTPVLIAGSWSGSRWGSAMRLVDVSVAGGGAAQSVQVWGRRR